MPPEDSEIPEPPKREAVEGRAEATFNELDTEERNERDRQLAEQVFSSILELGTEYTKRNPERAKDIGSEKILTTLTQSTFKSLEKTDMALTPEQKSAVEGMVCDFLQRIKDRRVNAKVELADENSPDTEAPIEQPPKVLEVGNAPKSNVDAAQGDISLSVVKDSFAYMNAVGTLADKLNGNEGNDSPIMKKIAELHIASTMYAFMKQDKEPSLNGNMKVGNIDIGVSSSADNITANVNGRFTFQYSREEMKKRIGT